MTVGDGKKLACGPLKLASLLAAECTSGKTTVVSAYSSSTATTDTVCGVDQLAVEKARAEESPSETTACSRADADTLSDTSTSAAGWESSTTVHDRVTDTPSTTEIAWVPRMMDAAVCSNTLTVMDAAGRKRASALALPVEALYNASADVAESCTTTVCTPSTTLSGRPAKVMGTGIAQADGWITTVSGTMAT
jgi:hypothetical protein